MDKKDEQTQDKAREKNSSTRRDFVKGMLVAGTGAAVVSQLPDLGSAAIPGKPMESSTLAPTSGFPPPVEPTCLEPLTVQVAFDRTTVEKLRPDLLERSLTARGISIPPFFSPWLVINFLAKTPI